MTRAPMIRMAGQPSRPWIPVRDACPRRAVATFLVVALLLPACATSGGRTRSPEPVAEATPECEGFGRKANAQIEGRAVGLGALQGAALFVASNESARASANERSASDAQTARVVGSSYYVSPTTSESLVGLAIYGGVIALAMLIGAVATVVKNVDVPEAGQTDAMAVCLRPALLTRELGPEHPEVARSLHALGHVYYRQGEFAKAEPLYLRALAIQERSLGANAPEVARALFDYAALLKQTGRTRQAWDVEGRAAEIHRLNP